MPEDDPARRTRALPVDTLGMTEEEMRRLGHRVVDMVVDRICARDKEPAVLTGRPAELMGALGGPLPEAPGSADEALDLLASVALAHQQHGDHPRYFARVPGPSSFGAVLGDWLGVGFNTIATSWVGGSGPTTVELVVLAWIREFLGMPADGEGILTSGGSMANLTALAAATVSVGRGRVYLTDQAHSSIGRALKLLGYGADDLCTLETDASFRLPIPALTAALDQDTRDGRRPTIVIASAGTTNTGAVDPLEQLAELTSAKGLWFHVDGAYGATAAAVPSARPLLRGLPRADSLVIDPHKWLFQPYDLGCTLIRQNGLLEQTFSMTPEYLRDTAGHAGEARLGDRGPELTRRSRALKLWMTFRTYGAERVRQAITRGIALGEHAERVLRDQRKTFDVVTAAQLGIVTFALKRPSAEEHSRMARELTDSGLATLTTTTLKGTSALRLCIMNPLTTERDLEETIGFLARVARPGA